MPIDMSLTALLVAPVIVLALTGVTAWAWRSTDKKVLLDSDKAALPFATAISVLAIGIPLVAAFLQEVLKSATNRWVADLLLSAMMLAALSLFVGAYVVYTLLLDAPKDQATGKVILGEGRVGLPAAMGCQYASLVAFLGCTVVALAAFAIQGRNPASTSVHSIGTVSIERPLPDLGTTRDATYRLWGEPDEATPERLEYKGKSTRIVFCFIDGELREVVYSDRNNENGKKVTCRTSS